jgi:tetratricopeptide (TPR) repeat protein
MVRSSHSTAASPQAFPRRDGAMSDSTPTIPKPTVEQKRIAQDSFNRAKEAIQSGNLDYAITLMLTCCKLEPANFLYRQTLRKSQKDKYGNNLRGSRFAFISTPRWKAKMKAAKRSRDYLRVIENGEQVLYRNPWDMGTAMDMAEAFDALNLNDLAVFTLDQARQKYPRDATLNRALARLFEKRGDYPKAIVLWQLVKEVNPSDVEAAHKAKDLAASATIQKGNYEEAAAGTKDSPVLGRIESRANEKQEKGTRESEPLKKRIEADPTEPSLYVQLAGIYRKYGQDDRARAALQQGLGPTGNAFQIQLSLMDLDLIPLHAGLEQTEEKLRKLKEKSRRIEADEDVEGDEEPLTEEELKKRRSKLLKEINTREIAIYRMKADRSPNEVHHRLELGIRLMKADLSDEAIAELQVAKRDEKLKWKAGLYLGICFHKRSNWRLAQRNFEEALAALPSGEEAGKKELLYHLATGSAENGDLPRALDLGHELANMDYAFKSIGKLIDEWTDRLQNA